MGILRLLIFLFWISFFRELKAAKLEVSAPVVVYVRKYITHLYMVSHSSYPRTFFLFIEVRKVGLHF